MDVERIGWKQTGGDEGSRKQVFGEESRWVQTERDGRRKEMGPEKEAAYNTLLVLSGVLCQKVGNEIFYHFVYDS